MTSASLVHATQVSVPTSGRIRPDEGWFPRAPVKVPMAMGLSWACPPFQPSTEALCRTSSLILAAIFGPTPRTCVNAPSSATITRSTEPNSTNSRCASAGPTDVEVPERVPLRNLDAAPDQRIGPAQDDKELMKGRGRFSN